MLFLTLSQVPDAEKDDSVFAQLQALFAQLALSKSTFAHPRSFWQAFKDYDGTPTDVQEHQDAYEFFTRLQVRDIVVQCHAPTNNACDHFAGCRWPRSLLVGRQWLNIAWLRQRPAVSPVGLNSAC